MSSFSLGTSSGYESCRLQQASLAGQPGYSHGYSLQCNIQVDTMRVHQPRLLIGIV